jgi:hypothetical protein
MGFFDKRKENRELNKQDRASRREAAEAAFAVKQTWLDKAEEMSAQYAGVIHAASSVSPAEARRTAQRVQRIAASRISGRAVIISARECREGMAGVGIQLELELDLTSGPGAPRRLTVRQDVLGGADSYPAGLEVPVKFDPENTDDAMIWATPQDGDEGRGRASDELSGADRVSHLEALAQLKQRGVLSEEQFLHAKSRLLADEW